MALALRALLDFNILDFWRELAWAAVTGMGIALVVSLAEGLKPKTAALFFAYLLFSLAYGYGALAEINYLPDHSPPKVFHAQVSDLRVNHGKTTTYSVILGRWGAFPAGQEVKVNRAYFESLHKDETVCAFLFEGYLGFRYMEVGNCPA
jgi:hypothetical protein